MAFKETAPTKKKKFPPFNLDQDLPWIMVAPNAPYFITETGADWTPVGQNDAVTWPDLEGLFRRKNIGRVERHLAWLADHGVTCLRLMLEYAQGNHRFIEKKPGIFSPNMIRLWDDLFLLCGKFGLRILLTPVDTFWMWLRWRYHPYNKLNGGPCAKRSEWLLCPEMLQAVKNRLSFAAERWGGSGVLFGWDLWNEIHPAHAGGKIEVFNAFIAELSTHLRDTETRLCGRSHPQTVSLFWPVLEEHPAVADEVFRHPMLDFSNTHFYDSASIDNPKDTVASAVCTGRLVREALEHTPNNRPFFDSEHGPIHAFKDKHIVFPEYFDDEYFRHMQWAHVASGAAGGGMRWPNRHPHCLTHGMRLAQKSLAQFVKLIDWQHFRRKNLNQEVGINQRAFHVFACADSRQAVLWLLRTDSNTAFDPTHKRSRNLEVVNESAVPLPVEVEIPGMAIGTYAVTFWNTKMGIAIRSDTVSLDKGKKLALQISGVTTDIAIAARMLSSAIHQPFD